MNLLHRAVDSVYELRRKVDSEETFLRATLRARCRPGDRLLDIGCGFSRFHGIITGAGLSWTGVDVNPEAVRFGAESGRQVYLADEFPSSAEPFDALLLAHIVEHLDCAALVAFFSRWLPLLKPGGIAVIFTPLAHRGFYDDFDHVKPYNPEALRQMLCRTTPQIQPISIPGEYREVALWIKRDPLWHSHRRGRWTHLFGIPLTLASVFTLGLVGKPTGYGMVIQRTV